ncbi:MAG: glucose 1-dehydrogenase [Chromatiales bacterium]|jgi:NAD(P)-dependent dehydrogenase (short-subunit alcohol dehydrogenase family)|nr:glucose 1-dehydrogenase [Chromatiales bacterium]
MSQQRRLEGKTAIVTGGSSGIGAETARQFAMAGASVIVCDVNIEAGQSVCDAIAAVTPGAHATFSRLDVGDEAQWIALMTEVESQFAGLDILANIAGVSGRDPGQPVDNADGSVGNKITEQTLEGWNRIMDVNSTGTFLGVKHAARLMAQSGGGSIINISSICGIIGSFSSGPYHASKGAVRLLSKAAAIQCACDSVRVNSVHPGFVDTPMTAPAHANNSVATERMNATPLRRFGTPYDIAMGCVYLASDESSWVTGSELVIDGGVVAS